MSLERLYTTFFENVTVSAAQDLLTVKAGTANRAIIRRISLSAGGVTAAAEMRVRLKRLASGFTAGSGGTTPVIGNVASTQNISSLSTVAANNTTQASGTATTLGVWQWNVLQDFLEIPPTEQDRWECTVSEALILDLVAAPASTVLSGFIVWEEP